MVDVRFEHLAKLGGYEWGEAVSVKYLFNEMIYRLNTQDISPAID